MRKAGKVLLYTFVILCAVLALAITFTIGWRPFIGPQARATTNRQFERTPQRLARGRYLVVGLAGCETRHSPKDWTTHGAPNLPGKELSGQVIPVPGLPGRVVASNLTPDPETGSANWTDDELARSIREGIGHDGRTIFPMMPYSTYRQMSDEDVTSIVVYLRSIPAVHNALPPTQVGFPVNYLVRAAPQPVTAPVSGPEVHDVVQRGKYLATLGHVASANITPDATGISYYDEATFVNALRTGYVGAQKLSSIMPFGEFKNLDDDDLKAIFAFLRTLPPVKHRVDNSLPPTYCKVCRQKHGAGDQN